MKARIGKRTIDVFPDDGRYYDPSDNTYYDEEDLIFDDEYDWQSFRREAAKDFISGMLANVSPAANQWTTPEIVGAALEIADELIKQLQDDQTGNR